MTSHTKLIPISICASKYAYEILAKPYVNNQIHQLDFSQSASPDRLTEGCDELRATDISPFPFG
jgi:hypothetical protein